MSLVSLESSIAACLRSRRSRTGSATPRAASATKSTWDADFSSRFRALVQRARKWLSHAVPGQRTFRAIEEPGRPLATRYGIFKGETLTTPPLRPRLLEGAGEEGVIPDALTDILEVDGLWPTP